MVVVTFSPLRCFAQEYSQESAKEIARVHYNRAREFYRQGEYSKARHEFREVLNLDLGHQGARWYLQLVEKLLQKDKNTFLGYLKDLKQKKLTQEKKSQEKRREEVEEALNTIEDTYKDAFKEEEQLTKLDQPLEESALEEVPEAMRLLDNTTVALMGDEAEAQEILEAYKLYEQGKKYMDQGLYGEAMACFDKVIEMGDSQQE